MNHKIFISHSFRDREWVHEFVEVLRKYGVQTMSPDGDRFSSGVEFGELVLNGITSADLFVSILSSQAVSSPAVMFELGLARGLNKKMAVIIISDKSDKNIIPSAISGTQFFEAKTPKDAAAYLQKFTTDLL
jgi:TIR domain